MGWVSLTHIYYVNVRINFYMIDNTPFCKIYTVKFIIYQISKYYFLHKISRTVHCTPANNFFFFFPVPHHPNITFLVLTFLGWRVNEYLSRTFLTWWLLPDKVLERVEVKEDVRYATFAIHRYFNHAIKKE